MPKSLVPAIFALSVLVMPALAARKWTDATGKYVVNGDLVGVNGTTVVVQKTDKKKDLIALPIANLSKADKEFLKSQEAADAAKSAGGEKQTWTMRSGLKVTARAVEYGRRDVTIQRRRGNIYVNDRAFVNLHAVQQKVLFKIVSHFEKTVIEDKKDLEQWILKLKGKPKTFTCDGVMLELENGDEYGVPFFLFSDEDLKILQPGWQRWLAAHEAQKQEDEAHAQKEQEALLLQAQADAYQRDREADRKLKMVELSLLAADAGVTDIWEVELIPRGGGYSRSVIVPGRNSEVAARAALAKFPNSTIGSISKSN